MSTTLEAVISAVFVIVEPAALEIVPTSVIVAESPGASEPTLQSPVPELNVPSPLAELNVNPPGNVSRTVTLSAVLAELEAFVTVRRQVAVPP